MDLYPTLIPIKHVLKVSEEKLKMLVKSGEDGIESEVKAINEIPDLECRMYLHVGFECLEAYLELLNIKEDTRFYSRCVFYIKSASCLEYCYAHHDVRSIENGVVLCNFADLFDLKKKFIVDGELIVEMKGLISIEKNGMATARCEHALIRRLWNDEEEKDFTIAVREENGCKREIKIHKIVLALRSPVFQRMFKTDMKEKQEGKVEIIDFDLDTVETAIAFCYDKEIIFEDIPWEKRVSLHQFADKYDIADLTEQTELCLVGKICFETICKIANAVINLNAPELQDFCFQFLLLSTKENIPIKDIDMLDNGIAAKLLKKSLSVEYC